MATKVRWRPIHSVAIKNCKTPAVSQPSWDARTGFVAGSSPRPGSQGYRVFELGHNSEQSPSHGRGEAAPTSCHRESFCQHARTYFLGVPGMKAPFSAPQADVVEAKKKTLSSASWLARRSAGELDLVRCCDVAGETLIKGLGDLLAIGRALQFALVGWAADERHFGKNRGHGCPR